MGIGVITWFIGETMGILNKKSHSDTTTDWIRKLVAEGGWGRFVVAGGLTVLYLLLQIHFLTSWPQ